jgi:hypothetical protein
MCPKGEVNVQVKHPNPRARYFPRTHGPSGEVCCSKQWPLCAEDSPLPHCLVCHSFGVSGVSSFASAFDLRHVALCAVGGQGKFLPTHHRSRAINGPRCPGPSAMALPSTQAAGSQRRYLHDADPTPHAPCASRPKYDKGS